jgi:hypothetical protein
MSGVMATLGKNVDDVDPVAQLGHHLVHVAKMRNSVFLAKRARPLSTDIANPRQPGIGDMAPAKQVGMPIGNPTTSDQCEIEHFSILSVVAR